MILPSELKPESVTAIVDTREQQPLSLESLQVVVGILDKLDYSVQGLQQVVRIKRKSLPDLIACIGRERERFDREVQRLLAFPVRLLIVEATWSQIEGHEPANPQWRGSITSPQVIGCYLVGLHEDCRFTWQAITSGQASIVPEFCIRWPSIGTKSCDS